MSIIATAFRPSFPNPEIWTAELISKRKAEFSAFEKTDAGIAEQKAFDTAYQEYEARVITKDMLATFETPTVLKDDSKDNIANTPLGVAAIEVAREKIGVDDHAYFTFQGSQWFVRQLRPHSFWIRQANQI